ncbi:hypothetical protein N7462_011584 [Penicillium macrosclerotiorum]|uniref:uncharacterized protein n=1 Tax=Penicillium macrosclerotiorum TaxID=303699 RepID=UPI002549B8FA|nr:uncharacterized protein N7462_011584 [Penicillium macrosclerotiorum]KAJ5662658.1 hypothetical protein N7462_011584 [Penicillium macrosclerotiorum]
MQIFRLATLIGAGFLPFTKASRLTTARQTSSTTVPLLATELGKVFDASVTIGNQIFQLLVDTESSESYVMKTGYTHCFIPFLCDVDQVNSLFSPPAKFVSTSAMYIFDCSVKAPQFGIRIGNQAFYHSGQHLIYRTSEGVCVSSLASSESVSIADLTSNILGVPVLKNVVTVFDFGVFDSGNN